MCLSQKAILFASVIALVIPVNGFGGSSDPTDLDADGAPGVSSGVGGGELVGSILPASGSVLVDRAHGNDADISGFTGFLVAQGWTVTDAAGPITLVLLNQYDVFIIPCRNNGGISAFSADEIAAVGSYVSGGGGVWAFHEFSRDPSGINGVTSQFGITFNDDLIVDPTDNRSYPEWPNITQLAGHAIMNGVSSFGYYAGCCINVGGSAMTMANGDDDASSANCPAGSYPPVLALVEGVATGCVVASGDITPLHPSYYPGQLDAEEQLLLQNIILCLLTGGPLPVEQMTWGAIKSKYQE